MKSLDMRSSTSAAARFDGPEWMVRWDTLVEVDEGGHGGLGIAPTSHGTFSWVIGMGRAFDPASLENEASNGVSSAASYPWIHATDFN